MFHSHYFKKEEPKKLVWCQCGEVRCLGHEWKEVNNQMIANIQNNKQEVSTWICKNCGAVAHVNKTTGEFDLKRKSLCN